MVPWSRLLITVWALLLVAQPWTRTGGAQSGADPVATRLRDVRHSLSRGELDAARHHLEALARSHPEDARVFNFLGVVYARQGRYREAEGHFLRALGLESHPLGTYLNLGRLYQENLAGDEEALEKAVRVYRSVLELDPANREAAYQLALLLHLDGRHEASARALELLPEEARTHPQALAVRCGNLSGLGRTAELERCVGDLDSSAELVEEDVLVVMPALRQAGRDDLGVRLLEGLHRRGKLSVEAAEGLAELQDELGNYPRAREVLASLADGHPDLTDLLVRLSRLSFRNGDYEGTLSYAAHARDLRPGDAQVHLLFGLASVELNLSDEAVRSLEEAVRLQPDNPYFHYALGAVLARWREASEAIPHLEKYRRMRPEDERGRLTLGEAYYFNKEYDRAAELFGGLTGFPETEVTARFYLGAIAHLDRRTEEALAHFRTVLDKEPDHVDALAELGAVHTRERDFDEARRVLERAVEIQPDHYQANFNLLTLYSRTRDERYAEQRELFEKLKEERWQRLTESLRTIEVVPFDEE
jgi:tetratricopeptide (TPR) repeat protein